MKREKQMKSKKGFEESIQEQINENAQSPSQLLNGIEFLELLSKDSGHPQKEQNSKAMQPPSQHLDREEKDRIIKKLRLKFELLKELRIGKDRDRER